MGAGGEVLYDHPNQDHGQVSCQLPFNKHPVYLQENFESTVHGTDNPSQCPLVSEYPLSLAFMALVTGYCSQIIFHYVLAMVPLSPGFGEGTFSITHASPITYNFQKRARQANGFAQSWT